MRLAVSLAGSREAAEAVQLARLAERLGFDDVWVTEDYCERGAFTLAGAIAAVTESVRIGIGVVNPWTRHPMLLAMEFAALDEVARGRGILGLGASNPRWMTDQLGIPFDRPIGRLRDSVEIVRAALAGQTVDHDGASFHVHARLGFAPPRRRPPLVLGVKGEQALKMAAACGDGLLLSILSSPAYVRRVREHVGPAQELSAYVAIATDDDAAAARERLRPTVATYLGVHGDHMITRAAGLDPDLAAEFRNGWRAGAPRVDLVDDEVLATFAVAGSVDEAASGLQRYADAGLDVVVVRDEPGPDPETALRAAREAHRRAVSSG